MHGSQRCYTSVGFFVFADLNAIFFLCRTIGACLATTEYSTATSRCENTTNDNCPSFRSGKSRLMHPHLYPPTYVVYVGAWCTSSGAEHLKPQEWDSVLIYSYILRRAVQPSLSKTVIPTSPGTDRPPQPHGRPTCVAEPDSRALIENSDKPEEYASNRENCFSLNRGRSSEDSHRDRLHPTGVGLRGLQGLRFVSPTDKTNQTGRGRLSRRPSSAPVRRQHEKVVSEARYLSRGRGQTTAREATFKAGTGDNGRGIRHTAPGVWGVEECKELRNELVRWTCPPSSRWLWQ